MKKIEIVWIVKARTYINDNTSEIQLITRSKDTALKFIKENICDFQEACYHYCTLTPYELDSYLGSVELRVADQLSKQFPETLHNGKPFIYYKAQCFKFNYKSRKWSRMTQGEYIKDYYSRLSEHDYPGDAKKAIAARMDIRFGAKKWRRYIKTSKKGD